ncbi:hypothetical protein K7I13_04500 [Brucepastera parasyntrophica]|uniref:hypothetical protein n=1 Tax=Brucepastera parasyntrophica TaxID=2880008 RepID=UPI00210ACB23|nr:hypothetical protein [Brucepastera parasyntrophica]ULQ60556.1 hypothetical protein K7I13_04500 [Brucepastera parasyntrophica]
MMNYGIKNIPALLLISSACLWISANEIDVPDLETRIISSGGTVSDAALPGLKSPAPAGLPDPGPDESSAPEIVIEVLPEPETVLAEIDSSVQDEPRRISNNITGQAVLGIGGLETIFSDFSLRINQEKDSSPDTDRVALLPEIGIDFVFGTDDGYGTKKSGAGYFDRRLFIDAFMRDKTPAGDWFAAVGFSGLSDGFQGKNADYFSISHHYAFWDAGFTIPVIKPELFSLTGRLNGNVFSSFPERAGNEVSGDPGPAYPIERYNGYYFSPDFLFLFVMNGFSAGIFAQYGFETVDGSGEIHAGSGGLQLGYSSEYITSIADVAFFADSSDGILVPFSISLGYTNETFVLRDVYLRGGLSSDRISYYSVAVKEPFALYNDESVYAADWNAAGGFTLVPVAGLAIGIQAEFRTTAANRGILAVSDVLDDSCMLPVLRVERSSLRTDAEIGWTGSFFSAAVSYSGEWLDRVYRKTLHWLDAEISVYDRGQNQRWKAGILASFALDSNEIPILSLEGSFKPIPNFMLKISANDWIPRIIGEERKRNGIFTEQYASIILSGTVWF